MITKIPMMSISMKKSCIRIHKETLHMIENPSRILLLVNPIEKTLVIFHGKSHDVRTLNVAKYMNHRSKSVEFYSTPLVKKLSELCPNLQNYESYKFYGEIIPQEKIVRFDMSKSEIITRQE